MTDKRFTMNTVLYADENVFDVFTWPMIKGDPDSCPVRPSLHRAHRKDRRDSVSAKKIPSDRCSNSDEDETFVVTGVVKDVPDNSSIDFERPLLFQDALYARSADTGY